MYSGVRLGTPHPLRVQGVCQGVVADVPPAQAFTVGDSAQVFVAKRHGGAQRLTGPPGGHYSPAWPHGGFRVALSTYDTIEIRSSHGRVLREIRAGQIARPPAWAPDDRRVAFVRSRVGYSGNLVVANVDDGSRRILVHRAIGQPAWSADGKNLFYLREDRNKHDIYAVAGGGGTPRRLVTDVASDTRLLVSPTGKWILFVRNRVNRRDGLWLVRPDGSGRHRVLADDLYPESYGWTFGGRAVFGGKTDDRHPNVRMLSGEWRRLAVEFQSEQYELSPDGGRVAWVGGRGDASLRTAQSDGDDERLLAEFQSAGTGFPSRIGALTWSPDGRRLAFHAYKDSY
jgi:TolB protein